MNLYHERDKSTLLNSYFNMYGDSYTTKDIKKIRADFGKKYEDSFTQIYYALNMMNEEENPYVGFANLIETLFGLDIKILEIGGGIYPALSAEIARRQVSIGKGQITIYDPLLSRKLDIQGVELIKREFLPCDCVDNYDLILGKEPCSATQILIDKSIANHKTMLVSPCKCYDLLPEYIEYDNNPLLQWYRYVKKQMNILQGEFNTYNLNESMHYDNPIYTKILKR